MLGYFGVSIVHRTLFACVYTRGTSFIDSSAGRFVEFSSVVSLVTKGVARPQRLNVVGMFTHDPDEQQVLRDCGAVGSQWEVLTVRYSRRSQSVPGQTRH